MVKHTTVVSQQSHGRLAVSTAQVSPLQCVRLMIMWYHYECGHNESCSDLITAAVSTSKGTAVSLTLHNTAKPLLTATGGTISGY